METTASIRATLQENDWVAFIDLKEASAGYFWSCIFVFFIAH